MMRLHCRFDSKIGLNNNEEDEQGGCKLQSKLGSIVDWP